MRRIAIFGDSNSIWIKSFVKEVLVQISNCEIYIFSDRELQVNEDFKYMDNLKVINCGKKTFLQKIGLGYISYFFKVTTSVLKLKNFDCFHIHYVNSRKLFIVNFLRRFSKRIIVTFWGSDLLRKNNKEILSYCRYLENVDKITVGSNDMLQFAIQKFPESLLRKTSVVRFGVNGLEPIHYLTLDIKEVRDKWNFPNDKLIISIGYNGSVQQNHFSVIEQLTKLSESYKNKLHVIFPMTYGLEQDYLDQVKSSVEKLGCTYTFLLDYMDSEKIAELCFSVDAFVHAQKTDAFSASVQEYLCAGKLLFNPVWIHYDELEDSNVYYVKYESFDELREKVSEFISSGLTDEQRKRLSINKQIIYDLSSWNVLRNKWLKLYE